MPRHMHAIAYFMNTVLFEVILGVAHCIDVAGLADQI